MATQIPTDAERTPGSCSVITRRPPGSMVRCTAQSSEVRSNTSVTKPSDTAQGAPEAPPALLFRDVTRQPAPGWQHPRR
ncbi:hypothetical protein GCM10010452_74200 [Crossiella cryophila]